MTHNLRTRTHGNEFSFVVWHQFAQEHRKSKTTWPNAFTSSHGTHSIGTHWSCQIGRRLQYQRILYTTVPEDGLAGSNNDTELFPEPIGLLFVEVLSNEVHFWALMHSEVRCFVEAPIPSLRLGAPSTILSILLERERGFCSLAAQVPCPDIPGSSLEVSYPNPAP